MGKFIFQIYNSNKNRADNWLWVDTAEIHWTIFSKGVLRNNIFLYFLLNQNLFHKMAYFMLAEMLYFIDWKLT